MSVLLVSNDVGHVPNFRVNFRLARVFFLEFWINTGQIDEVKSVISPSHNEDNQQDCHNLLNSY